jgi:starch phosphorylase
LDSQWGNVQVKPPRANTDLSTLYAGDSFTATTAVYLGHLRPEEVRVELCHGPADSQNRIRQHHFVPMTVGADHTNGWFDYTCKLPMPESGRFGLTARVIPAGAYMKATSPGYITWATDTP